MILALDILTIILSITAILASTVDGQNISTKSPEPRRPCVPYQGHTECSRHCLVCNPHERCGDPYACLECPTDKAMGICGGRSGQWSCVDASLCRVGIYRSTRGQIMCRNGLYSCEGVLPALTLADDYVSIEFGYLKNDSNYTGQLEFGFVDASSLNTSQTISKFKILISVFVFIILNIANN